MAVAATSTMRVACVGEAAYGTIPANPTFATMRLTNVGGGVRKKTVVSDEIRADRNVSSEAQVGVDVGLDYEFELSYGGVVDTLLQHALKSSWVSNVLKNGTSSPSLTIEETLIADSTNYFARYIGTVVDDLSLTFAAGEKIKGSMSFIAQSEALASAALTGATYTAATTSPSLNAANHVGLLSVGGLTAQPKIKKIDLKVSNNLRRRNIIGQLTTLEPGMGQADVTGSFDAYFESNELYQAMLNHGSGAITLQAGAVAGSRYQIVVPVAQFLTGERRRGSKGDDVMVTIPFRGIYSSADSCSISITKAV